MVRTEGELDPQTRMINVVARVEAPYAPAAGRAPLAVGLFVDAEIHGRLAKDVAVLPRSAVRPDNQVLVVDSDDRLHFRSVTVLRTVAEQAYISDGLAAGERVCISPLDTALEGMTVRIAAEDGRRQQRQWPVMKGPIAWFAHNHVAANLLLGLIVLSGLVAVVSMPQKSFPDIDIPVISITVPYLGAAPEEVEQGVCIRIEEELEGVEGVKQIRSNANEGVLLRSRWSCSRTRTTGKALDDVKNRVDAIDTFPVETEKPIVNLVSVVRAVLDIAVTGPTDERTLKVIGQQVRDDMAKLPGVTQVELRNTRPV